MTLLNMIVESRSPVMIIIRRHSIDTMRRVKKLLNGRDIQIPLSLKIKAGEARTKHSPASSRSRYKKRNSSS